MEDKRVCEEEKNIFCWIKYKIVYRNISVDPVEVVGNPGIYASKTSGGTTVTIGRYTNHCPPAA